MRLNNNSRLPNIAYLFVKSCMHSQDNLIYFAAAGVGYSNCSDGDLRLSGGLKEYEGRVEICINNLWGSICYSSSRYGNSWDINDGRVACRSLGYQELGTSFCYCLKYVGTWNCKFFC